MNKYEEIITFLSYTQLMGSWEYSNILNKVKGSDSPHVKIIFTDLTGTLRSLLISKEKFIYFSKNYIPLDDLIFFNHELGDFHLKIDLETSRFISWQNHTPIFIANISRKNSHFLCPRSLLTHAVDELLEKGYDPQVKISLQLTLFTEPLADLINKTPQSIFLDQQLSMNYALSTDYEVNSFISQTLNELQNFDLEIEQIYSQQNINRYKIVLCENSILDAADQLSLLKMSLKELSQKNNYYISFSVPTLMKRSAPDNSLNISFSLNKKDNRKNLFKSGANEGKLNDFVASYILGIKKYAFAMSSIYNSSIKCYRDLSKHSISWGVNTPDKFLNFNSKASTIQINLNSSENNPYLLLVTLLKSGFIGQQSLANKASLQLKSDEQTEISYPQNLDSALETLLHSNLSKDILPLEFIKYYHKFKKDEWNEHEGETPNRFNF